MSSLPASPIARPPKPDRVNKSRSTAVWWPRFARRPVGYRGAVTHLLTLDPGDIANRTHDTTEPGTPLRSTWVLGWRELRQLVVAYVAMTGVFALVGWLAFGDNRRWWLVDADERVARWFAEQRTDPLNTLFSGAPAGALGPRTTGVSTSTSWSKLLTSGGSLTGHVAASADRVASSVTSPGVSRLWRISASQARRTPIPSGWPALPTARLMRPLTADRVAVPLTALPLPSRQVTAARALRRLYGSPDGRGGLSPQ